MLILNSFKRSAWWIGLGGLVLFVAIVAYQGVGAVSASVTAAGWGLLWVSLFHFVPVVVDAYAWQRVLGSHRSCRLACLSWIRWIGEGVNNLLPVAQIGGNLVRARLLTGTGVSGSVSNASVVVDVTAGVVSQILFALMGVVFLLEHNVTGYTAGTLLLGLSLFVLMILGFYLAQRRGLFLALAHGIERLTGAPRNATLSSDARELDRIINAMYTRKHEFLSACAARLLGWISGAGEVWLALYFLGHPVSLADALLLESLGQAIRSAAFVVPGALGVQEGGYLVLGMSIGLAPQIALSLALIRRVRELLLGLPALLVWHWIEGRRSRQGDNAFVHNIRTGE